MTKKMTVVEEGRDIIVNVKTNTLKLIWDEETGIVTIETDDIIFTVEDGKLFFIRKDKNDG